MSKINPKLIVRVTMEDVLLDTCKLMHHKIELSVIIKAPKKCHLGEVDSPSGQVAFHSHLPNGLVPRVSWNSSFLFES